MSTALLPAPQLVESDTDDYEAHLFCCDPDVSLCGLPIPDEDGWEYNAHLRDEETCELCLRVADEPCDNPKCPDRRKPRFWQVWR